MIVKEKKKLTGRALFAAICGAALIVALTVFLAVKLAVPDKPDPEPEKPDIIDGEDIYNNVGVAYPTFAQGDIQYIDIDNGKTHYYFLRDADTAGNALVLCYDNERGETTTYYPQICFDDPQFSYSSLYATDSFGESSVPRLTYLTVAVGTLYFNQRIPMAADAEERALQMKDYGLDSESRTTVYVAYRSGGETKYHVIRIGDELVTGGGYYYTVDDREYVYVAMNTSLAFAKQDYSYYINPRLTAAGLTADNGYEPYLTPEYKQWRGVFHNSAGERIAALSRVTLTARIHEATSGGYTEREKYSDVSFDLSSLASDSRYSRVLEILKNSSVGVLRDVNDAAADPSRSLWLTVPSYTKAVNREDGKTPVYSYTVHGIDACLTGSGELVSAGSAIQSDSLIRIKYSVTVDGEKRTPDNGDGNDGLFRGLLDLADTSLPEEARAALASRSVGDFADGDEVTFSVTYDDASSRTRHVTMTVTDIIAIYGAEGKGSESTVTATSRVLLRCYYTVDGVRGTTATRAVSMAAEGTDKQIIASLLGKSVGTGQNFVAAEYSETEEIVANYVTYEVASIDGYTTEELTVSFAFVNASKRDPYFGESLYANTTPGRYSVYGINYSVCENVIKILGGIGKVSGQSDGMSGNEVVALGVTPDNILKYGLYRNRIKFVLPRNIIDLSDTDDSYKQSEFDHLSELSFMLYVSDVQADGTRYVASDMYDVIVKVDGDKFSYLEYSFVDLWARRTMMATDIKNVTGLELTFGMTDVYGKYIFTLNHTDDDAPMAYLYQVGDCMRTEFSDYFGSSATSLDPTGSRGANTLANLYNHTLGGGNEYKLNGELAGDAYFKEVIETIYFITYSGTVSEEEQAAAAGSPVLMKLSFRLGGSTAFKYSYEFRRISDRKVMVTLYQEDMSGNAVTARVSDFCVSSFAFKKVAQGFVKLLNGEVIDSELPDIG